MTHESDGDSIRYMRLRQVSRRVSLVLRVASGVSACFQVSGRVSLALRFASSSGQCFHASGCGGLPRFAGLASHNGLRISRTP